MRRFAPLLVMALAAGAGGCGRGGTREQQAGAVAPEGDANAPAASAPAPGETAAAPSAPGAVAPAPAPPGAAPGGPAQPTRRDVTLFFERSDDDALGPETRPILLSESIIDQAKQIVSELASGPHDKGLLRTVPEETKVLGLYLDRSGTAFVDLSGEFVDKHPGGSSDELATVFSIVDSLTYNLPDIRRVRFLVNGEERETLASHLDLRRAYIKDMSIVKMDAR